MMEDMPVNESRLVNLKMNLDVNFNKSSLEYP